MEPRQLRAASRIRPRQIHALLGLALAALLAPCTEAAELAKPDAPIAALGERGVWVQARVGERFRDAWILEDDSGRILVDLGGLAEHERQRLDPPPAQARWLLEPHRRGWRVRAVEASAEASGAPRAEDRPRLPGQDWTAHLQALGYQPVAAALWTGLHYEVLATNPFGELVELHFDSEGTVYKERHQFDARPSSGD